MNSESNEDQKKKRDDDVDVKQLKNYKEWKASIKAFRLFRLNKNAIKANMLF